MAMALYKNWRIILTQFGLPQLNACTSNQAIYTSIISGIPETWAAYGHAGLTQNASESVILSN